MKSSDGDGDDDGNENGKRPNSLIRNNNNNKKLHVQHSLLYISLPLFCSTTTWNFLVTHFMEKMSFVLSKDVVARAPVRLSLLSEVRYFRGVVTFGTLRYLSPYYIVCV